MDIKDNIKTGITIVGETVSEIASSIAEKNRIRIQLNHLKALIKTDAATRDQAYIELGRFFYENLRDGASEDNEALCSVIDSTSERITDASMKYVELLNLQNETKIRSENTDKLKKIVAEKAAASAKTAKEKGAVIGQKAKDVATDAAAKAKEVATKAKDVVVDLKDKAVDTVGDVKDRFSSDPNGELEQLIAEEQAKLRDTEAAAEAAEAAAEAVQEEAIADTSNEESPEDFSF